MWIVRVYSSISSRNTNLSTMHTSILLNSKWPLRMENSTYQNNWTSGKVIYSIHQFHISSDDHFPFEVSCNRTELTPIIFVRSCMQNPSNPTSNCNKFHFPSSCNFGSLDHSPNGVLYVFSWRLTNPAWAIFELIVGHRSNDCPVRFPASLKSYLKAVTS